jgi:hypothetical protein
MVSIEDFMIKNGGGRVDFSKYNLDKIAKHQKRTIRILEDVDSDMIKKFVYVHCFIPGVGNTVCTNTKENISQKKYCLFCTELVEKLNKIDRDHFEWLKTLDTVDSKETDKFNLDIAAKSKEIKDKLIFKDGSVVEVGKTFDKDISNGLSQKDLETYNLFNSDKQKAEGQIRKCKFLVPVYDYATCEVKIYEMSPSIWNKLDEVFSQADFQFTSADIMITHNAVKGNWWLVSKKDSSAIDEKIIDKYSQVKEEIKKELERRTKTPTAEEQILIFQKYKDKVNGVSQQSSESEKNETKDETIGTEEIKDLF